jgi:hypothetical protein
MSGLRVIIVHEPSKKPFEYPEIIDESDIAIWNNQFSTGIIPDINRHIYE